MRLELNATLGTLAGLTLFLSLSSAPNSDSPISVAPVGDSSLNANVRATLDTIAWAEGTDGEEGYQTQFTGTKFNDHSDHPREQRCSGDLCSDAAGRYQFLSPTWDALKEKLGLPDFSPESQDKAAVELLRENGALEPAQQGLVDEALEKVRKVWASLPGAGYGQPEKNLDDLQKVYQEKLQQYGGSK